MIFIVLWGEKTMIKRAEYPSSLPIGVADRLMRIKQMVQKVIENNKKNTRAVPELTIYRNRQCLCPNFCFCEIRYQPSLSKPRFSWFKLLLFLIFLGVVVTGAIFWNHDPSLFPGQFGYWRPPEYLQQDIRLFYLFVQEDEYPAKSDWFTNK